MYIKFNIAFIKAKKKCKKIIVIAYNFLKNIKEHFYLRFYKNF